MKNFLIISSSPNSDGLTAACATAAGAGLMEAGAGCETVSLNDCRLEHCRACDNGWGICRQRHICCIEDDFSQLQQKAALADGLIIITPVYWGEPSEAHKAFFDRLRRCEATAREASRLQGKPAVCVAAAGGSGGGTLTCLMQIEQALRPMSAVLRDRISITRFNREAQLDAIRAASRSLAMSLES